jgi:hypothetical protein
MEDLRKAVVGGRRQPGNRVFLQDNPAPDDQPHNLLDQVPNLAEALMNIRRMQNMLDHTTNRMNAAVHAMMNRYTEDLNNYNRFDTNIVEYTMHEILEEVYPEVQRQNNEQDDESDNSSVNEQQQPIPPEVPQDQQHPLPNIQVMQIPEINEEDPSKALAQLAQYYLFCQRNITNNIIRMQAYIMQAEYQIKAQYDALIGNVNDNIVDTKPVQPLHTPTLTMTLQQFAKTVKDNDELKAMRPDLYKNDNFRNILINMTDIQYYISNDDMYDIADHFSCGTFAVGAVHVPKFLDDKPHEIIVGDKVEGLVRIHYIPKPTDKDTTIMKIDKMIDLCKTKKELDKEGEKARPPVTHIEDFQMLMRMNGNDHTYLHDLHMYALTLEQNNLIPTTKNHSFILKLIVDDRCDCGGTFYVRYHIVKIKSPQLHDFFTSEVIENYTMRQIATLQDIYNTMKKDQTPMGKAKLINAMISQIKKFRSADIHVDITNEQLKLQEILTPGATQTTAFVKDDQLLFTTKKSGRIFNYYKQIKHTMQSAEALLSAERAPAEIVNRLVSKIMIAEKFDQALIVNMINYVNKEHQEWDINERVLPIIMFAIQKAAKSELTKTAIMNSVNANLIGESKNGQLKLTAQTWTEAWNNRQIWTYLMLKLRRPFNTITNTDNIPTTTLDF